MAKVGLRGRRAMCGSGAPFGGMKWENEGAPGGGRERLLRDLDWESGEAAEFDGGV